MGEIKRVPHGVALGMAHSAEASPTGSGKLLLAIYILVGWRKGPCSPISLVLKRHWQHCSLHLSFSHTSLGHLVLCQPGFIGCKDGVCGAGLHVHRQQTCTKPEPLQTEEQSPWPATAKDVNIAGEGENVIETVYLGGLWD